MPPKKDSSSCSTSSLTAEGIAEMFRDTANLDYIATSLGPFIARAVDSAIRDRLATMQSSIDQLVDENEMLRARVEEQGRRLEDVEIYLRSHDLIIWGLPEKSYAESATASLLDADAMGSSESHASVSLTVLDLCSNVLKIDVEDRDITVAHRLKKGKNDHSRSIIVRFASRRIRDDILRARKKLFPPSTDGGRRAPPKPDQVFICEHLTRTASNTFFAARMLVKGKKLAAAWTYKGLTNIKKTTDPNEKPTVIRSEAELSMYS